MDQNFGLMGDYVVYTGYFWLLNVQGHSEVIRHISIFSTFNIVRNGNPKMCGFSKMDHRRAKRIKIWFACISIESIQGTFNHWCSMSFRGDSVHSDFRQPRILKMNGRRAKRTKIWATIRVTINISPKQYWLTWLWCLTKWSERPYVLMDTMIGEARYKSIVPAL